MTTGHENLIFLSAHNLLCMNINEDIKNLKVIRLFKSSSALSLAELMNTLLHFFSVFVLEILQFSSLKLITFSLTGRNNP